jgi:hypothetical protein
MNKKYPNINRGGCGIFAVHIAKRLQNIVPVRIVVCDYYKQDLDKIRDNVFNQYNLSDWNNADISFVHLVVEFEYNGIEYHYDTDGVRLKQDEWDADDYPFSGYPFCDGSFTIEEISSFVARSDGWNPTFNRKEIPLIERKVKNLFKRFIEIGRVYYTPIEHKRLEQYRKNPTRELTTRLFLPS